MDHVKNIKNRFGPEIRSYIKENLDENLIHQIILKQREVVPHMVHSGLDSQEIERALLMEPQDVEQVLYDFAHSTKRWPALSELTRADIEHILEDHPLIKLKETVKRVFLVGSLSSGREHAESDIDILLEVKPRKGYTAEELADKYRRPLQQYFVTHNIRGKDDSVHPNWREKRIDVYFTYDADLEARPKIELK